MSRLDRFPDLNVDERILVKKSLDFKTDEKDKPAIKELTKKLNNCLGEIKINSFSIKCVNKYNNCEELQLTENRHIQRLLDSGILSLDNNKLTESDIFKETKALLFKNKNMTRTKLDGLRAEVVNALHEFRYLEKDQIVTNIYKNNEYAFKNDMDFLCNEKSEIYKEKIVSGYLRLNNYKICPYKDLEIDQKFFNKLEVLKSCKMLSYKKNSKDLVITFKFFEEELNYKFINDLVLKAIENDTVNNHELYIKDKKQKLNINEMHHDLTVYNAYLMHKEKLEKEGNRIIKVENDYSQKVNYQSYEPDFTISDLVITYEDKNNTIQKDKLEIDTGYSGSHIKEKTQKAEDLHWYTTSVKQMNRIKKYAVNYKSISIVK